MLLSLREHAILASDVAGRLGSELSNLANGGLPIVPTILMRRDAFWAYQNGTLPSRIFSEVLALLSRETAATELLVSCSPTYDAIWCENDIRTEPTISGLRNAVERLFRSISSPRSRATRAAMRISAEDAAPGVLIQRLPLRGCRVLSSVSQA